MNTQELAKQLGLESVEELEVALDSMEGIAEDGGELDTSISREARVRSAYLDWCKEYGKEPDEARFPQFSTNYLAMEAYANENGKEMTLNKYADFTEEEYIQLSQGGGAAAKPEPVAAEPKPAPAPAPEPVAKKPEAPAAEKPKGKYLQWSTDTFELFVSSYLLVSIKRSYFLRTSSRPLLLHSHF